MAIPTRFLFVCTGNTCRSPMAAALFRREAERRGLPVEAKSAGLADGGSPASRHAVEAMAELGVDLSSHLSQTVSPLLWDGADVIAVMSASHRFALASFGAPAEKIVVLGGGIADPFGGSLDVYRATRDQLADAVAALLPPLRIVPMAREHTAALAAIEAACFASRPWSENALLAELDNDTAVFLVALKDGETVGYLGMHQVLDEADIARVAVRPDTQGQGVGFWLLAAARRYAETHGGARLMLDVRESNTKARALYETFGFVADGRRGGFYDAPREDAILYSCWLNDNHK